MFIQFTEETMTKVVISGYYGFKNFGDETILSVLINHLKDLNAVITVFSSDPEYTSTKYAVNSVYSFNLKEIIKNIKNSDILISGGGSLLQDVTSIKNLIYYLTVIALALLFNKKVIIFAQGIGPINNKFAQILVKNLLKQCSILTVRDENSLKLLSDWKIKADLVCDPVYSLEIKKQNGQNSVGIQLRDFKTMNYNLLQKLALLVSAKFSDRKIEIFSLQESQDLKICRQFETILKNINPSIETEIVTENIIDRISRLEYLFAMRFHAILTALKCGVKTCAINYDIKVEKLAKEANLPTISMNADENMEQIFHNTQNLNSEELIKFAQSKTFDWTIFKDFYSSPNKAL